MKMISIEEKKIWRLLLHAIHDLRTSLHSVGGFAYLIKEDGRQPSLSEFIYIDPDYKNGRRVFFSIAI